MFKKTSAFSLIAAAGLATSATAQLDLYLVNTVDIGIVSDTAAVDYPARYVGRNPSAIAFTGTDLLVGGVNNVGTPEPVQIVRIGDVLGTPTFTAVPGTMGDTTTFNEGYQGFDWDPATSRLLATRRGTRVNGVLEDAISLLEFDAAGMLLEAQGSDSSNGEFGARTGPAFDWGADGLGFDYLPFDPPFGSPGDGTVDGPVPATLVWGDRAVIGMFEGLSTDPGNDDSDFILSTNIGFAFFDLANLFVPIVETTDDTTWRDLDIHPTDGTIVARANNQLIVSSRNADDTAEQVPLAGRITPPNGTQATSSGQNCEILTGAAGGDVVIWNDRWDNAGGKPFNVVQRATRLSDETNVAINWLAGDGSALTFGIGGDIPDGNGFYSYSWDEATGTLAVCDFTSRIVYFFSAEQPSNPCACELDGTEGVNVFDLLAFLDLWFTSDPGADLDGTPGVDVFDLLFFLDCWFPASAGAPCP